MFVCYQVIKHNIADHKPLLDRLNKTGSALLKLVDDDEAERLQELLDNDNARFEIIKNDVRERANSLDEALQETSEVSNIFGFQIMKLSLKETNKKSAVLDTRWQ